MFGHSILSPRQTSRRSMILTSGCGALALFLLAVPLATAALAQQSQASKPKAATVKKGSAAEANTRTLLIQSDADCAFSVDDG